MLTATNSPDRQDTDTVTCQKPDLSVKKVADAGSVNAGGQVGFTITSKNAGPGGAVGVGLSDALPAGVTWGIESQSDVSAPLECAITGAPGSQVLACDYGSLAVDGSRQVHVTASTSFTACATYENTAVLTATNSPDRQDTDTTTCREPATVRIVKSVSNVSADETAFGFTSDLEPNAGDQSTSFSLAETDAPQVFRVHPGETYTITEDNPLTKGYRLTSADCAPTVSSGPTIRRQQLNENAPVGREATTGELAPGADVTCTFTNERLSSSISVVKSPTNQVVYLDGTASYSYEVTASGDSDLQNVTLVDDHCANVTPASVLLLEAGKSTTFTCDVSAAELFASSTDPITNTATASGTDRAEKTVQDTDTALTRLLTPAIAIDKTGPATGTNGALLSYTLVVTNPGNTSFPSGEVKVTDVLCQEPPTLVTKNADATPGSLDPGDSWTYLCQVQTVAGQTQIVNTGLVTGTDTGGKVVSASDPATTLLSPPTIVVDPIVIVSKPGLARLAGTVGCVSTKYSYAAITGSRISRVTFTVNGRKVKTLTKPNSGRRYLLRYRTRFLSYGSYSVQARVVFVSASQTRAKTLHLRFFHCRPRVIAPKFTG